MLPTTYFLLEFAKHAANDWYVDDDKFANDRTSCQTCLTFKKDSPTSFTNNNLRSTQNTVKNKSCNSIENLIYERSL